MKLLKVLQRQFTAPKHKRVFGVGTSQDNVMWFLDTWREIADCLLAIVGDPKGVSVRSRQGPSYKADVKFGRLTLKEEDHLKWCHGSESNDWRDWEFCDTEVWFPSRAKCGKTRSLPDLYFQITDSGTTEGSKNEYNQVFHLVVERWFWEDNEGALRSFVARLADLIECPLLAHRSSTYQSINELEDFLFIQINYRGGHLDKLPNLKKIRGGKWRSLSREELTRL